MFREEAGGGGGGERRENNFVQIMSSMAFSSLSGVGGRYCMFVV